MKRSAETFSLELDAFDLKILKLVQAHGRMPIVELAERIGLSPTPTQRRLSRLENSKVIERYSAVLERGRLGLGLTVFLQIKVENHQLKNADSTLKSLLAIPEIINCHIISGDADLLAEIVVKDLPAYETLLMNTLLKLPMIKEVRSNFSLRSLKSSGPLHIQGARIR